MPLNTPFDAPIPGQALTMTPKSIPSERPPEFADPHDALDWLMQRFIDRRQMYNMLALLEGGISVETLTNIVLKQGFVEGKWSGPMIYSMMAPVAMMLVKMAKAAGVNYRMYDSEGRDTQIPEIMLGMIARKAQSISPKDVNKAVDAVKTAGPAPGKGLGAPSMDDAGEEAAEEAGEGEE